MEPNKRNPTAGENPEACRPSNGKRNAQDPQSKIEKEKRKRGKCYIRVNPVPDPADIRFINYKISFRCLEYLLVLTNSFNTNTKSDTSLLQIRI